MSASTSKFHISKKGSVEPCNASVKACPLGGQHFDSEDDAQDYLAFEAAAEKKANFQRAFKALQMVPTREGSEVEIKDRFGQKKLVVVNREWQIKDAAGQLIGGLEYRMVKRERRGKGKRYVSARWYVPAWVYHNFTDGDLMKQRISLEATSKKAALESMLRSHLEWAASK